MTAYDEAFTSRLALSGKQIGRLLADLESEFDAIVKLEGKKKLLTKKVTPEKTRDFEQTIINLVE